MTTTVSRIDIPKGFELTRTGIVFHRTLSDPEYDALGIRIARMANATAWAIGDWLLAGTGRGPEGHSYDRAHELTGRSYDSLSQYLRLSAAFSHDERELVPWSLYREAMRLPVKERLGALALAQRNGWNRNGLIDFINTRLDERNALNTGAHESDSRVKKVGRKLWRKATVPKRDVRCPYCGKVFDVRRRGLTEAPIEVAHKPSSEHTH